MMQRKLMKCTSQLNKYQKVDRSTHHANYLFFNPLFCKLTACEISKTIYTKGGVQRKLNF